MATDNFKITNLNITPVRTELYLPPVTWRGDPVGHIGNFDVFFWVLEGEMILFVDSDFYLVKAGQLAFLPKGKLRKYTQVSKNFSMYEMRFLAENEGINLMEGLKLNKKSLVANISDKDNMNRLFESSYISVVNKNPIYDVYWCSNILNIIKIFYDSVSENNSYNNKAFEPIISYMRENISSTLTADELSKMAGMQKNYFIRQFKKSYGAPPLAYFGNIKVHKAIEMLISTDKSIDEISKELGISDTSYFSRWFKKSCSITPTEYRKIFKGM